MNQAIEIKRAWKLAGGERGQWLKMTDVAGLLDMSAEDFKIGVQHLIRTDADCEVMPESNQKTLTATDRAYRVRWAGDDNDLITWL